jgi:hypothetical protein
VMLDGLDSEGRSDMGFPCPFAIGLEPVALQWLTRRSARHSRRRP